MASGTGIKCPRCGNEDRKMLAPAIPIDKRRRITEVRCLKCGCLFEGMKEWLQEQA